MKSLPAPQQPGGGKPTHRVTIPAAQRVEAHRVQSPNDGAESLGAMVEFILGIQEERSQALAEVAAAEAVLENRRAALALIDSKAATLYRSVKGNPGLMHKMLAQPHDAALHALLKNPRHLGWTLLQRRGGDAKDCLGIISGGFAPTCDTKRPNRVVGGSNPRVWINCGPEDPPTFEGLRLGEEAKRVMNVPDKPPPQLPPPPPRDDGDGGPSSLRDAPDETFPPPAKPKGRRAARTTPRRSSPRPRPRGGSGGDGPPHPCNGAGATAGGRPREFLAADLGLDVDQLEAAMPPTENGGLCGSGHPDDRRGGHIARPLELAGGTFAVIHCTCRRHDDRDYQILQVTPEGEWEGPQVPEPWRHREKRLARLPATFIPKSWLLVTDPDGGRWVLHDEDDAITVHTAAPTGRVLEDPGQWADALAGVTPPAAACV